MIGSLLQRMDDEFKRFIQVISSQDRIRSSSHYTFAAKIFACPGMSERQRSKVDTLTVVEVSIFLTGVDYLFRKSRPYPIPSQTRFRRNDYPEPPALLLETSQVCLWDAVHSFENMDCPFDRNGHVVFAISTEAA